MGIRVTHEPSAAMTSTMAMPNPAWRSQGLPGGITTGEAPAIGAPVPTAMSEAGTGCCAVAPAANDVSSDAASDVVRGHVAVPNHQDPVTGPDQLLEV